MTYIIHIFHYVVQTLFLLELDHSGSQPFTFEMTSTILLNSTKSECLAHFQALFVWQTDDCIWLCQRTPDCWGTLDVFPPIELHFKNNIFNYDWHYIPMNTPLWLNAIIISVTALRHQGAPTRAHPCCVMPISKKQSDRFESMRCLIDWAGLETMMPTARHERMSPQISCLLQM